MNDLYLVIGLVVLAGVVGMAFKFWLWFWIATTFLGRPVQQYRDRPAGSPAGKLKTWLTIIATILGIVSTTVGLLEKCSKSEEPTPRYIMPAGPQLGSRCCAGINTCQMIQPGVVGSMCTCVGMFGVAQGTVCQ